MTDCILVVEDDPAVRALCGEWLRPFGRDIFTAPDGLAGLSTFEQHQSRVALVVADVSMPRLDGVGMIYRMLERAPELRVLFICAALGDAELPLRDGHVTVLLKPFTGARFRACVAGLLAAAGPGTATRFQLETE